MFKKKLFLAVGALMSVPLMACFGEGSQGFGFGLSRGGVNPPGEAVELDSGLKKASWTQQRPSDPQLDLLVVIDASGSLGPDFDALNASLSSFLETVVEEKIDFCIGYTIADPDPSKIAKHLVHASDTPAVVCTDGSTSQNATFLANIAKNTTREVIRFSNTTDEGGLGAFRNAITVDEIKSKYQSEGFFRDRAAISVLFMADEADYYEANDGVDGCLSIGGVRLQPNGAAVDSNCLEAKFRFDFYSNPDGTRAWTLDDLLADVRTFQGTLATSFAQFGIRNIDTDRGDSTFFAQVTYGYNEFIEMVDGAFAPIRLASDAAQDASKQEALNTALKDISEGATQAAITLTVFDLPDLACAGSLEIEVAGNDVGSDKFRTSVRKIDGKDITRVVINPSFVGESGDLIEMTYRQDDGTGSCDG